MGSCNTQKNEKGGKDLLLKICKEIDVDIEIGTGDDPTKLLAVGHGLVAGDLVRFLPAELGTISDVTAGTIYYVVSATDDAFSIAVRPGGSPITFTSAASSMGVEVFNTIGGLRSKSFSFASQAVDTTNHGSNEWREILDGAGLKTVSVSGEGVYTSADNYRAMEESAFNNELVCLAFIEAKTGRVYVGCFKIVSIEASGEYSGEGTYSMSAESASRITISQAPTS